tara:strand:- start:448 stop:588 length:141 start_codon:yes stop_codon:yes gene_type:complete
MLQVKYFFLIILIIRFEVIKTLINIEADYYLYLERFNSAYENKIKK